MLLNPVLSLLFLASTTNARPATSTVNPAISPNAGATPAAATNTSNNMTTSSTSDPTMGVPSDQFAANLSPSMISSLAQAATGGNDSLAEYSLWHGSKGRSNIYGDWANFTDSSAYYFVADMDVDCDGINYQCKGNPDGLNVTDWGALSAYSVPWIVIPYSFISRPTIRRQLVGNNVAAVICNDKMFYGIFGDSNGDEPEVIGEASWLLARTCFPDEDLSGAVGHGKADVTYIVFNNADAIVPDVGWSYLHNFDALRTIGDTFITRLVNNLGL